MDIVIVGAGEVGHHLADILSREEHRVTVIDVDPAKMRRLMESLDVQVVVGDGTRADVLNDAGASQADLLIAVSDNDRVNLLACLLGMRLGAKRRILRLKDMSLLQGYRYFYKQSIGFDLVLSTEELAAEEIVAVVREKHALEVESFAEGRVQLRRLRLDSESELTAEPISGLRLPAGVLIVAVSRKDRFFVPGGDDQLQQGDQVYILGSWADLDAFELLAGAPQLGRRSVVIMGGGSMGRQLVHQLHGMPGIALRVLERDPDVARALAAEGRTDALVLEGDATDLDLLLEERIGEANLFVATTGDDEQNMVACQLVRSLGVERTVALVNKASYRQIYDLLGIDQAISPRILCANRILRFVRSSSLASIAVIGDGRAEVLELEVHFPDRKGARKVKSLDLPKGTVLGALVRRDDVTIPNGETTVEDGDHVIVFTLPEHFERVERTFGLDRVQDEE